jgi:hypothetical protein
MSDDLWLYYITRLNQNEGLRVTIQSRVDIATFFFGKNSVVGLGARPGRAGSTGRDPFVQNEITDLPPKEAGSASPGPFHGEISASWFQAEWTGSQTMGRLSHSSIFSIHPWLPTLQ